MDIEFAAKSYFSGLRQQLEENGRSYKAIKVKSIMQKFGYSRRSQVFVDSVNNMLDACGLYGTPYFSIDLPLDSRIYITLKNNVDNQTNPPTSRSSTTDEKKEVISVKHDLFYYLFDFGSEYEYERFQASLDSNQPIALFLIPKDEDFLIDLVFRILSYELLRKSQYQGSHNTPLSSRHTLSTLSDQSDVISGKENSLSGSGIFRFNHATMSSVILGESGLDLLDSEEFEEKFEQLSLYANKYNQQQSFIIFQCPSEQEVRKHAKSDLLGHLANRVSNQIPLTFTLRYKFPKESMIACREEILDHLRLLLELPRFLLEEDDISLIDYFLELHKAQVQAEAQLLLKMGQKHFNSLTWGYESDEHIYLKYFAIKTLEDLGKQLSDIKCEASVSESDEFDQALLDTQTGKQNRQFDDKDGNVKRRPDVSIPGKVIVEVETLRKKGSSTQKVFFDLIDRTLGKASGWPKSTKEIWLVLPGFEIARNYYQIKKSQEILESLLPNILNQGIKLKLMTPDYENHQLMPVSFDQVDYPSLQITPVRTLVEPQHIHREKVTLKSFSDVSGLEEEKKKLRQILKLKEKGQSCNINGIVFYGLPGCGKTLLARAFANESERYFLKFSPADIQSIWIGQTQKNIQKIFSQAKRRCPSLLFIDELDSIGFSRNEIHAHTDQKATVNQLLIELENLKGHDVLVVAATNYLSRLDGALKRSGRLDWKIPIFPPDQNERKAMYKLYFSSLQIPFDESLINFDEVAERSIRFTSSDIEAVCNALKMEVLLEEIKGSPTTSDLIFHVNQLKEGGLSLEQKLVEDFIAECKQLGVKSPKIEVLKADWGLT
jgi:ATP-dependent 26S proteasome regulatory subunit